MASKKSTFVPFKMPGSEDFSEEASYGSKIIEEFTSLVVGNIDKVVPLEGQPFVIGDYGTADGGASFPLVKKCLGLLRRKFGDSLPIQILYEDQPINDFKAIFHRAIDLEAEFGNVYVMASGTSFYQQCSPDNSLDFIFSSCANHWLSQCPLRMTTTLICAHAPPEEQEIFRKQAEEDWEMFLLHRSRELKPGGIMVILVCEKELTKMKSLDVISTVWRSMVRDEIITEMEFLDTNFMIWHRTVEEIRKPFEENTRVTASGLVLVDEHRVAVLTVENDGKGKVKIMLTTEIYGNDITNEYVKKFVRTVRSSTEMTLYSGLNNRRSASEKHEILETFYTRFSEYLKAYPERLYLDKVAMSGIVVQKVKP